MKNPLKKIILISFVISVILTVPAYGTVKSVNNIKYKESPVAEYFNPDYVSPEFEQWEENGKKGKMPELQDKSYLKESYLNIPIPSSVIPEKYDLRDYGLIEPVYDQMDYGICWAVAANVVASSPLLEQFPQLSLSPYHTSWFTYRGNEEEEAAYCDDPYKTGGFNAYAISSFAAWKGPVYMNSVTTDPYNEGNPPESMRFNADFHMQDSFYMPSGSYDESENLWNDQYITKKIILENGPVAAQFLSDDEYFNYETNAWYNNRKDSANHQVVIAGWDDNYPRKNFIEGQRPKNNGAWLVRNSWGTSWGDDGYFWLSYEDKTLGLSNAILLEEKDNYEKNYQYDTLGWTYSIVPDRKGGENKSGTAANIFKAEKNEMLEAVSFYTTDALTDYEIKIYNNVNKNEPETGTLSLTQSDVEPFAGYHTIELEEPVKLSEGENFSIVLTLTNTEFPCAIPVEMRTYYDKNPPEYMGKGGESYILSNGKWKDIAGYMDDFYVTNVCIKGFTNPLPESGEAVGNVRYSEKAGPVKDGTEIELSSIGSDEIYYSFNGRDYELYQEPVVLNLPEKDSSITVYSYGVKNGLRGNIKEKTYTKAKAELTDLATFNGIETTHYDTACNDIISVFFESFDEDFTIMAQSSDEIYVDGKKLKSGDFTEPVKIPSGCRTINITVKGLGKEETEYTIKTYKDLVKIDYLNEKIIFDDNKYRLTDPDGRELKSGDSITEYADREYDTYMKLVTEDGGEWEIIVPARELIYDIPIDFEKEKTLYSYEDFFTYSDSPDMSNSKSCNDRKIALIPGKDMYFRVTGTEDSFASNIYHLEVPERPDKPVLKTKNITSSSVSLKKNKGTVYSMDKKSWNLNPYFENLKPGKKYTFYGYKKATDNSFASDVSEINVKTLSIPGALSDNSPDTGDNTPVKLWGILLSMAITLLIILILIKKANKKNK